jgi:xylulokinase
MADGNLLIGLDIGTTGIKGVLLDVEKGILHQAVRSTELLRPKPGRVEFSAEGSYQRICEVIRELLAHGPAAGKVAGIALSGATGNTGLFDRDMRPLCNVISWMDERAILEYRELLPGIEPESVYRTVGWPFSGMFPLAHLAWLRRHRADLYGRAAHRVMDITHLYHRLCGNLVIDRSTATTSYLQDQATGRWHGPLLAMVGLSVDELPVIHPSGTPVGLVCPSAIDDTGLDKDAMVVLGAFDHPSAARAVGVTSPGDLMLSCGTSWVGFYPVADRGLVLSQRLLADPFLSPDGPWGAMFSISRVGVTLDHLLDELVFRGKRDYAMLDREADAVPPGANGLSIDPLDESAVAPEQMARMRASRTRPEACRAIMEGVAFASRRRIEQLRAGGIASRSITMVGGPAESPAWTRIVAGVTGLPVRLVNGRAAGAVGAALLAGHGAGILKHPGEAAGCVAFGVRTVVPPADTVRRYDEIYKEHCDKG